MGKRQKARKERRNLKLVVNNKGPKVAASGLVAKVDAPNDEKELLKTVPATVTDDQGDKHVVGEAFLYDDGSVDIKIDDNAPEWAVDKIKATEKEFGYTIGGMEDGPA